MPIRAENKSRYPKDWKRIRAAILERAGNRCEFCGAANHALGYWGEDEYDGEINFVRVPAQRFQPGVYYVKGTCRKIIRIVLTVAHLDHQPENCDPENLRALCQRCHNRHDAKERTRGKMQRARAGKRTEDLRLEDPP